MFSLSDIKTFDVKDIEIGDYISAKRNRTFYCGMVTSKSPTNNLVYIRDYYGNSVGVYTEEVLSRIEQKTVYKILNNL